MERLNLGVAQEIITPKLGVRLYGYNSAPKSESINDALTATVYYFRQGDKKALMINLTLCVPSRQITQTVCEYAQNKYGISADCCMVCATHTHTGPSTAEGRLSGLSADNEYMDEILIPRLMSGIDKAVASSEPVKMAVGQGESLVGINRREILPENEADLGQNPWGCFDPRMTILSFKNDEGNVIANMIHYGCHCTAAGAQGIISRDWPGTMVDTVAKESGGITAFFNGPEGDVGPRLTNGTTGWGMEYVQALGGVAAQDAMKIYNTIFDYRDAELKTSCKEISIPLKKRIPLEAARAEYREKYEGKDADCLDFMKKRVLESTIASYENGEEELETDNFHQNLIVLGNIVFAGYPYEIFSEIGLRVDKYVKDARVLSLVLTNESRAYFITESEICRGGYEVEMFTRGSVQPYVNNADWHLITQTVEHIKSLED